jgi:hypothetical protein
MKKLILKILIFIILASIIGYFSYLLTKSNSKRFIKRGYQFYPERGYNGDLLVTFRSETMREAILNYKRKNFSKDEIGSKEYKMVLKNEKDVEAYKMAYEILANPNIYPRKYVFPSIDEKEFFTVLGINKKYKLEITKNSNTTIKLVENYLHLENPINQKDLERVLIGKARKDTTKRVLEYPPEFTVKVNKISRHSDINFERININNGIEYELIAYHLKNFEDDKKKIYLKFENQWFAMDESDNFKLRKEPDSSEKISKICFGLYRQLRKT